MQFLNGAVGPRCENRPADVRRLQELLIWTGIATGPVDGRLGPLTQNAILTLQRRNQCWADGIVSSNAPVLCSLRNLSGNGDGARGNVSSIQLFSENIAGKFGAQADAQRAEAEQPSVARFVAQSLSLSERGIQFLYGLEAQAGISDKLHWPKGASGVTLGAGYDMKERSPEEILKALQKVGIAPDVAKKVSEAAGLRLGDAGKFAEKNRDLVKLSIMQEKALLKLIVPHYEKILKRNINARLAQHEFDALVSFTFNPGASIRPVTQLIDDGKTEEAMAEIRGRVNSGGAAVQGLVRRREKEVALFLHATY